MNDLEIFKGSFFFFYQCKCGHKHVGHHKIWLVVTQEGPQSNI